MKNRGWLAALAAVVLLLPTGVAQAQDTGSIEGQLTRDDGSAISGAVVELRGTGRVETTDAQGTYRFSSVPAGSYTLGFSLGDDADSVDVEVADGENVTANLSADWELSFLESITVFSASRRPERVTEAPAAVTVVTAEEIEREAAHGQLPKLIEFTPGAEVTQSGIYDYNVNTRGFNSSLNRRVATLVDGRDSSVPFLGAQEWAAISFPLDDIQNLELVRGPSAALYGANASSGVLNMTTKSPRYSQGGQVRLTGGELSTFNADLRWAAEIGAGWYFKLLGGIRNSGDFTVSRNQTVEYAGLPMEAVPLAIEDDNKIGFASARFDKHFAGSVLTFEAGQTTIEGPAFQTGIGRVQLVDIERPWARVNFTTNHWNVLAYQSSREATEQLALSSGTNLALDTERRRIEVQTNWDFGDGRGRFVGGAVYGEEEIDSLDPATGRQSLVFAPIDSDNQAVYGQVDWEITDRLKFVLAGRWDDSTLHDSQFSPKGALVFSINPNHTLRLTYNEAFQVPNYSEFFLQANVAAPLNLSPFEAFCAPFGVSCGFGSGATRILAVGNEALELEEVQTVEIGYSAILGERAFLTIDYYQAEAENFVTDLIPQLGTALGRVNPAFGAYTPPAALPAPAAAGLLASLQGALGPSFAILSNNFDGTPILTAVSYANFGQVDTQGIDLGLNVSFDNNVGLLFSYSWFDFDIANNLPGFDTLLVPNTPEAKAALGLSYSAEKWDGSISARWVDDFDWAVGPFVGVVDSYTTVDLNANYELNDRVSFGLNVANLFDDEHYESFGGDILGRRALGNVAFSW